MKYFSKYHVWKQLYKKANFTQVTLVIEKEKINHMICTLMCRLRYMYAQVSCPRTVGIGKVGVKDFDLVEYSVI